MRMLMQRDDYGARVNLLRQANLLFDNTTL